MAVASNTRVAGRVSGASVIQHSAWQMDADGGGGGATSLLDYGVKTARHAYATPSTADAIKEKRQRRRAYHRIMSGIEVAYSRGQGIRFLTLTSPQNSTPEALSSHFRALKERIKRRTPLDFVKRHVVDTDGNSVEVGYIDAKDLHKCFPNKGILDRLDFRYMAIRTNEGNGVLHILYAGDYLPRQWLSDTWLELHGAWDVDIRKGYGKRGLAGYAVSQYCSGQSQFVRYSWSWSWVWQGFVKSWQYLKYCWRCASNGWDMFAGQQWDIGFSSLLAQWQWHLQAGIPP